MFQLLTDRGVGIVQPKGSDWVAVRAPRHRNRAVVALQRGPYGDATAMPLQTNGGLTARKSRFFGVKNSNEKLADFLAVEEPGGPYENNGASEMRVS